MKTVSNYTVPSLGFPHIERALIAGYRFSETPPDWSPEAIAKYKEENLDVCLMSLMHLFIVYITCCILLIFIITD